MSIGTWATGSRRACAQDSPHHPYPSAGLEESDNRGDAAVAVTGLWEVQFGLLRESAANVSTILSGPAPQALQKWLDMQRAGNGDSVFLTDLEPWIQGDVVQLNAGASWSSTANQIARGDGD